MKEEIKEKLETVLPHEMEGGGVQVGGPERRGMHQPSPLRKNTKISSSNTANNSFIFSKLQCSLLYLVVGLFRSLNEERAKSLPTPTSANALGSSCIEGDGK